MASEIPTIKELSDAKLNAIALNVVMTGDESAVGFDSEGGALPSYRKLVIMSSTAAGRAEQAASEAVAASVAAGAFPASAATTVPVSVSAGRTYWVAEADGLNLTLYTNQNGLPVRSNPVIQQPTGGRVSVLERWLSEYRMTAGSSFTTEKVREPVGNATNQVLQNFGWLAGRTYDLFLLARADERKAARLSCNGGFSMTVDVDLNALTAADVSAGVRPVEVDYKALGNGWLVTHVAKTPSVTLSGNLIFNLLNAAGSPTYVGDGVSGVYVEYLEVIDRTTGLPVFSSRKLSAPQWVKANGTSVADATVSQTPVGAVAEASARYLVGLRDVFGERTGDKIVEASGSASTTIYDPLPFVSGQPYTAGIHVARDGRKRVNMYCNTAANFNATFNLELGTVESGNDAVIEAMPDGSFWCSQTVNATSSASGNFQVRVYPSAGGHPYVGDGSSGIAINAAYVRSGSGPNLLANPTDFSRWKTINASVLPNVTYFGGNGQTMGAPANVSTDIGKLAWLGKKIGAVGTSIFFENNVLPPIASKLGATVVNLGFSGGSLGQNFSGGSLAVYNRIPQLPVDCRAVLVDAQNDFGVAYPTPLGQLGDTTTATFYGALYATILRVQNGDGAGQPWQGIPNVPVFFLTPFSSDSRFATYLSTYQNSNGNYLWQFQKAMADVAAMFGYPVIDVGRKAGIGMTTGSRMLRDGLHPNPTPGGDVYSDYVVEELWDAARRGILK